MGEKGRGSNSCSCSCCCTVQIVFRLTALLIQRDDAVLRFKRPQRIRRFGAFLNPLLQHGLQHRLFVDEYPTHAVPYIVDVTFGSRNVHSHRAVHIRILKGDLNERRLRHFLHIIEISEVFHRLRVPDKRFRLAEFKVVKHLLQHFAGQHKLHFILRSGFQLSHVHKDAARRLILRRHHQAVRQSCRNHHAADRDTQFPTAQHRRHQSQKVNFRQIVGVRRINGTGGGTAGQIQVIFFVVNFSHGSALSGNLFYAFQPSS